MEISDKPFMNREETSKYTAVLDGGKARQFSFTMEAKSVITFPSGEMKLPGAGFYEISAFILAKSKIVGDNAVMNAQTLSKVEMPNKDGFIADPRPDVFNYR